ncbi:MAG: [protein-PII] uridylyltransferase [Pseudomonadota bacterium]
MAPETGGSRQTLFESSPAWPPVDHHAATLKRYRDLLHEANQTLRRRFLDGAPIAALVHGRARLIDHLLKHVWTEICSAPPGDIALIAVGGYGRGELHPGSDVDLLILLADDTHAATQKNVERFITFLWDIGLEVGHSVRSPAECVREADADITVATNLMEARLLIGPSALFRAMQDSTGPQHIWPSRRFFEAKWREQIQRHHKYHDTAYNLEPNIKEGPGGLRDIQMIGWVAKRHFGAATLHDLVGHGFLTEQEFAALDAGQNFLWQIRFGLHTLAQRREDRLLLDYQRSLAQQFGYQDDAHHLAVEQFMKRYYRTVMELSRLNEMLLQLFQEAILLADEPHAPVALNKRFQARNQFIEVTHEKVFQHYPFALLEIFLLLAQHRELQGVRASTIRLIRNHRHLIDDKFRADLRCRALFMELLRQPSGIAHELQRMNRYGVLGAYLPAFGDIVGQMQHDLFHVYTVDEHTLFLLRNLRRFALEKFAHEFPLCSEIFQRLPKPEILYLAGLFHDIAKGRGGDHSELGAHEALAFCLHHGMSRYDANLVAWLVQYHLIMSATAQRQDIGDPAVINAFAARVRDQTHLDYLYLLTVADIRATNPTLWNDWKNSLLMELYAATTRALARGLENPLERAERIRETQAQAQELLQRQGVEHDATRKLWNELGDDYFLRYAPDEIAWHAQAILAARDAPLILMRQRGQRGGTELFIYAPDRDYLFAAITGALDQLGLNVHDARIVTARNGYTLNSFIILEESGAAIEGVQRNAEIAAALKRQLLEPGAPGTHVTRRVRRQLKHFPIATQVSFDQDTRNQRTIMEVVTADRPGLLAKVGKAFVECGVRLQTAKIATLGARAEDIFFITDAHNRPLTDISQLTRLRKAIVKYLDTASG